MTRVQRHLKIHVMNEMPVGILLFCVRRGPGSIKSPSHLVVLSSHHGFSVQTRPVYSAVYDQTGATTYLKSKQLLLFCFAGALTFKMLKMAELYLERNSSLSLQQP